MRVDGASGQLARAYFIDNTAYAEAHRAGQEYADPGYRPRRVVPTGAARGPLANNKPPTRS
jgi:hypothetical protein